MGVRHGANEMLGGYQATAIFAAIVIGLFSSTAVADDAPNLLEDSFYAALGSFILNSDTELRLDGEAGDQGTRVDWERTFGDKDLNRFRFDGFWRFADRHKVRALVFTSSRDSAREIQQDIEWGDVTYPAMVRVESEFKFAIYELAYEYAFLRRENYEVTGSFGFHYTELEATLGGEASIQGGEVVSGEVRRKGSFGVPLPVIGLRGMWRLPANFWLDASAQLFAASIDEYDGNLQDYRIAAFWQPKSWLGLGIGYNRFTVDVDITKNKFRGNVNWTYQGPMIFYSGSF